MKKITSFLFCLFSIVASAQIGTVDPLFNTGVGPDGPVDMIALQPDGKMVIAGGFKNYNGVSRNSIARINADGSLDTAFNPGTGVVALAEYINSAVLQPDGKIIIAGDFTFFDGVARNRIARLNADGSLDTAFNPGTGANSRVVSVSLQTDGKIIIAGQFTTFNSLTQNRIARLNTNGSLDSSFVIGTGTNSYIWTTCIQPDGKIIIGGGFTLYNGTTRNSYARLNPNGSIDTSFAVPLTANQAVLVTALQPDGKIVIGGYFTTYGGVARARIARTNANGTLDTSFNPGTGADAYPISLAIQPDGKIMMGGDFTTYNGVSRNRLARLNADGSLDTGFNDTGMNGVLNGITLQPDGKMMLGGHFTTYNNLTTHPFLVRLLAYDPNAVAINSLSASNPLCQGQSLNVNFNAQGFYQAGNVFTAQLSDASGSFASPVAIGTLASTISGSINVTTPANAVGSGYRIRVVSSLPLTIGADNGSNLSINASATYYADADGDGYGNNAIAVQACGQSAGYVLNNTDCNDSAAAIHPGQSEILYNGLDDNCSGTLDEGFQITTKVGNAQCGSVLNTLSALIACGSLPNITRFRFEVTNTTTNAVQIIERVQNYFALTMLASYDYSTTYSIRVELQRNGVWLGYYGEPCLVSSPNVLQTGGPASINAAQCNTVLPTISTLIATTSIANVTGYKFRVTNNTNPLAPNQIQTIETGPQNWFALTALATFHYGTTYTVEVAIKTNGSYSNFGSPCTITSPAVPQLTNCGGSIASVGALVTTASLNQVTMYRFQITNLSNNVLTTIDRSQNYFTFHNVPQYIPGGLYTVQVSVKSSGSWSPFGNICQITAPPAARMSAPKANDFNATAYPNPFSEYFNIDIKGSGEPIAIKTFDMTGRLLEATTYNPDDMQAYQLGSQYPSGVYNVVVSQGENVKTLRIIKR